jgi:hypothetical protein
MKNYKIPILAGIILILFTPILYTSTYSSHTIQLDLYNVNTQQTVTSNLDIIDEMLQAKLDQYNSQRFFSQVYEPSLRATYYGLYILNSLDRLDLINQTEITNYIMSHYNEIGEIFSDPYSDRYLDTDFSKSYYPLHSYLETNCYALLSLDILNETDLIDPQHFRNFIWSCYHPDIHGFIGQPYDVLLNEFFKIPTSDNTYFAIKTLNMLNQDWDTVQAKELELVNHLRSLQIQEQYNPNRGGMLDDLNDTFYSLDLFHINLHSSYYCYQALEFLGYEDMLNEQDFHTYLEVLYNSEEDYFEVSRFNSYDEYLNLPSTAMAIELAEHSDFQEYSFLQTLQFLMDNKNEFGMWNATTIYPSSYELIDTFQVIRSLTNLELLYMLTPIEKEDLAQGVLRFFHYNGFSLISKEVTRTRLIHSILNSFDQYERSGDLNSQELYEQLMEAYVHKQFQKAYYFYSFTGTEGNYEGFRSFPIEFHTSGYHIESNRLELQFSFQSTFEALDSMKLLGKLDDFENNYNLTLLLQSILDSQFLENGYSNFGGFLPCSTYGLGSLEYQNNMVYLKYSYYAIRILELLCDHLGFSFEDLDLDFEALYTFISRNIIETATEQYFNPRIDGRFESLLENTYYAVYVLNSIELNTFKTHKIQNFILRKIDYANLKSVYFSYELSNLMGLDLEFDVKQTHPLIQEIYNHSIKELYQTLEKTYIDQRAIFWLCDMAVNDRVRINPQYLAIVGLGSNMVITVTLCNIVLEAFGPYTLLKFESIQLGTYVFDSHPNNTFSKEIFIPIEPENHPKINGNLVLYDGSMVKTNISISFNTTTSMEYSYSITEGQSYEFKVTGSLLTTLGKVPLCDTQVYVDVYTNGKFNHTFHLSESEKIETTEFRKNFLIDTSKNYYFEMFLDSEYREFPTFLTNGTYTAGTDPSNPSDPSDPNDPEDGGDDGNDDPSNPSQSTPNLNIFGFIPGVVILLSSAGIGGVVFYKKKFK